MCFDGYMAGCGWRGGVQCVMMSTWQGAGGEAVFTVLDGYMAGCGWRGGVQCFDGVAGCGWRGSVHCVLMGWQGVGGEAVFTVF